MKRSDLITIGILIALVTLLGVYTWYVRSQAGDTSPLSNLSASEQTFMATSYQTFTGEPVSLEQHTGDVLVVNAWASWCPFCVAELPDLAALADIYQEQGVTVVAINRAEPPTTAAAYLQSVNVPTTGSLHVWLDTNDAFYKGIGGFTMPETIIYNRDGTVNRHKRGFMNLEEMQSFVNTALTK